MIMQRYGNYLRRRYVPVCSAPTSAASRDLGNVKYLSFLPSSRCVDIKLLRRGRVRDSLKIRKPGLGREWFRLLSTTSQQLDPTDDALEDQFYGTENVEDEFDDDNEFVLQHVPSGTDNRDGKILEAWFDTVFTPSLEASVSNIDPFEQAMAFLQETKTRSQEAGDSNVSTESYNAVLKSLSTCYGDEAVEEKATEIVAQMKTTDNAQPDINTYNYYIGCIRRGSTERAAQTAIDVLNDICSPDNSLEPTVSTYNAVLAWCSMSESVAINVVDNLYKKMVLESQIKPNRETFLFIFHALAHEANRNGVIDHSIIECWLDRMEENLGRDEINGEILTATFPSIASLDDNIRWSFELQLPSCSSWKNQWIEREQQLFPGVKVRKAENIVSSLLKKRERKSDKFIQCCTDAAQKTEAWYELLSQKYSNSPTIETFQDIISAWVQTGTTDGLVRAEFWAMKALASPDLNNGRTFEDIVLPILLGWAQIDEACRLERVEDWIKKLEEISVAQEEKGLDNIKPSDKIIGAAILSWRNHQKWLLRNERDLILIYEASLKCTMWLEQYCSLSFDEQHSSEDIIDASLFAHVIDSWRDVTFEFYQKGKMIEVITEKFNKTENLPGPLDQICHVVELMRCRIFSKKEQQKCDKLCHLTLMSREIFSLAVKGIFNYVKSEESAKELSSPLHPAVSTLLANVEQILFDTDVLYPEIRRQPLSALKMLPKDERDKDTLLTEVVKTSRPFLNAFSHDSFTKRESKTLYHARQGHFSWFTNHHTYQLFYLRLMTNCTTVDNGYIDRIVFGISERISSATMHEPESHHRNTWLLITKHISNMSILPRQRTDILRRMMKRAKTIWNENDMNFYLAIITKESNPYWKFDKEEDKKEFLQFMENLWTTE